jgi:mannose-6-phosphate isomerase
MKKLEGVIKHYDWGGHEYLPGLLNLEKSGRPSAEYWLGTHPDGMALLEEEKTPLQGYLKEPLSFLMKVLDVRDMLSIQVHPDKNTAERGFAEEEASGKPRDAFDRIFRDENHKPELMVALSDFWLVQGFKTAPEIIASLDKHPELRPLKEYFGQYGLKKTYEHLMTMPQPEVNAILQPLGKRIKPLYENHLLEKSDIDFWAARAYFIFNRKGVCDRGIFSLYLMNLIRLDPGEGIYQAPGMLHAYLEGQNIECMAASDNVIRGGLTSKYIDTDQLLKIVHFESITPRIITPVLSGKNLKFYHTPASEFQLLKIVSSGSVRVNIPGLVINLGIPVVLNPGNEPLILNKGDAALIDKSLLQVETGDSSNDPLRLFLCYHPRKLG